MASIVLGTGAAARDGPIAPLWLALTVLCVFAVEIAKNASGEIVDWDSGVDRLVAPEDRSPFSGGKRVLVDGLLTRGEAVGTAFGGYAAALVLGIVIALGREPAVLPLGLAGAALAFFYHVPPLRLAYRGWGELAVGIAYGPGICAGTYLVQHGAMPGRVILLALPLGTLVAAFLWINEFPDARADAAAGKRTLVVRLGRRRAAQGFAVLVAAALAGIALLPLAGWSLGAWLGLAAAVPATRAAVILNGSPEDTPAIVPAQRQTLLAFVIAAVGTAAGLVLVE